MKGDMKKEIKSMPVGELMKKLSELQAEKMKLESYMFRNNGSSVTKRNYPIEIQTDPHGNIKRIKKDIARVKTWLHIKLKAQNNKTK